MNKLLKISAAMAFLFLTSQPGYTKTASQQAFDEYMNTYQQYQNAVVENKSRAEIQNALNAYQAAKKQYEVTLGNKGTASSLAVPEAQTMAPDNGTVNAAEELNSVGIPLLIPRNPVIANLSDIQRDIASLTAELDSDVQELVKELRETQDPKRAQEIVQLLENRQATIKEESLNNLVKYEIATALDRLSLDDKKVDTLLDELKASRDPRFVKLAELNTNYKFAKAKKKNWQVILANKNDELNNTKARYRNASWLAFPVKIYRGIESVVSNAKFTYDQADYEEYMIEYEAIQANFITNVESVFNEWQAKITDPEEVADVRLVYDNYDAWYARWNLLNSARSTIDVQYFIIENDCFGLSLLGTLLKKANEGVKIRLMVDTRGSNQLSILSRGYLVELAKNGNVEVRVYNPITSNIVSLFTDVRKVESSNHDKIMIVDGEKCVVGGRNIANTYLVNEIDMDDAWRDCDCVIDSEKICSQLKLAFDEEFNSMKSYSTDSTFFGYFTSGYSKKLNAARVCMESWLTENELTEATGDLKAASSTVKKVNKELAKYAHMTGYNSFNLLDDSHRCAAHVLDNNSLTGDRKDITENMVKYIDAARTEIIIQNPYFALTDRAEAALKRASKRGVPIYIHSNSERSSDSAPTEAAVLREWKTMLTEMPTMRFFARNSDGQLHGKTFSFDGKVAIVGSYNFDSLSEKVNSEIAVAIKSEGFAADLRAGQMDDIQVALEYHMATDTQEEFAPDDVKGAKMKVLTKLLSHCSFLDPLF